MTMLITVPGRTDSTLPPFLNREERKERKEEQEGSEAPKMIFAVFALLAVQKYRSAAV